MRQIVKSSVAIPRQESWSCVNWVDGGSFCRGAFADVKHVPLGILDNPLMAKATELACLLLGNRAFAIDSGVRA
jgi:hypothetical protein